MRQLRLWGAVLAVAWGFAGRALADASGVAHSTPNERPAEAERQEAERPDPHEGDEEDGVAQGSDETRPGSRDEPVFVFANAALVPTVSTNTLFAPRVHNALSVALVYDRIIRLSGLQLTPGAAAVEESATGLQLAGLVGVAGASLHGLQLGGLVAVAGTDARGLQLGGLVAVSGGKLRGGQLSLLASVSGGAADGLQLSGLISASGGRARGLQLAGLVSGTGGGAWGLQVAGLVSGAGGTLHGGQVSGLVSGAAEVEGLQLSGLASGAGALRGLQLGLVANGVGRGRGAQVAGVANIAQQELTGVQLALVNVGARVHGLQVGLVNVAERMEGVQLGLVNVAERMEGVPVGLVSRMRGGPSGLDVWAGELVPLSAAWRTGSPSVHSLLGGGVALLDGVSPTVLAGLGVDVPLGPRLTFSPDLVYHQALRARIPLAMAGRLLQLRLVLSLELARSARGFAGLTANAGQLLVPAPTWLPVVAELPLGDHTVRLWPGAVVGVSL